MSFRDPCPQNWPSPGQHDNHGGNYSQEDPAPVPVKVEIAPKKQPVQWVGRWENYDTDVKVWRENCDTDVKVWIKFAQEEKWHHKRGRLHGLLWQDCLRIPHLTKYLSSILPMFAKLISTSLRIFPHIYPVSCQWLQSWVNLKVSFAISTNFWHVVLFYWCGFSCHAIFFCCVWILLCFHTCLIFGKINIFSSKVEKYFNNNWEASLDNEQATPGGAKLRHFETSANVWPFHQQLDGWVDLGRKELK